MTFFGQDGVEKFFFYFSLKAPTKVFKISHSKKIFIEKKFYFKIAVSALPILHRLCCNLAPTGWSTLFGGSVREA